MSKPRHHPLKILAILTLLLATGCLREPPQPERFSPGEPLYERLTTRGKRTIITGPDGPVLKTRTRPHSTKIFDHKMRPLGTIAPTKDDQIQLRPLTGPPRITRWIDDDVAELPQGWRLERATKGFDIFLPDGTLIGLLRRQNDAWILRPHYRSQTSLTTRHHNGQIQLIDHADHTSLVAPTRHGPIPLLITSLDDLPLLDRAALAIWLDHNLSPTNEAP